MLVGSAIVFAANQTHKEKVFRVIWLYELSIQKDNKPNSYGIMMRHLSDSYCHTTLIFKEKDTLEEWLEVLKVF